MFLNTLLLSPWHSYHLSPAHRASRKGISPKVILNLDSATYLLLYTTQPVPISASSGDSLPLPGHMVHVGCTYS